MEPLYTRENCKPAYELRWSLALFVTDSLPPPHEWLSKLKEVVERDGVRILEHHICEPVTHLFLEIGRAHV